MKTGNHKILGNIDQLQTDQYFQLASGTEDEKLTGDAFPQGSVRYNSTIDRMEGVVRSTDTFGDPHPGRWSPFVIPSEIGACDPDAADMFASYVGTVLNSAEDAKILFINLRYSKSRNLPSFPTGRFLPSNCNKDDDDPANVIISVDNLETCTINTNPNNPRINVTQNENVSCCGWQSCPTAVPTQSSMVLDLFNYFDIPTAERKHFYITPYACIKGFNMTNSGGHCYNVLGGKIFLQPITSNPEDPRFGQFRVRLERAQLTDLLSFSVYLTINRFDNFVPTCENPPPIEPPPAMPTDIVIHCTEAEFNTNTMKDLNIKDWITNEYWQWANQPVNVTVKVYPGAVVGAGPGGAAGINASDLPPTSTITIDVSGTVLGAGGTGGAGEGNILSPETLLGVEHPAEGGGDGDTAILGDNNQLTINTTSTGMIIGGSGGGAGARGVRTFNGELLAGASGGGGQARGPGAALVHGGWKSEDGMLLDVTFSDGNDGKDGNFTSGGSGGAPKWVSTSFKIPGNFANVEGYGFFNRTTAEGGAGGEDASAGENSISLATPAQGVILLKNSADYTGSFRIANNRYNFKQCPSDTRTCWDGSIKTRRPDNNCEFDDCPNPPILDFVRDSVTEENTIKMDYQLLNHGNGNTSRSVQIRMVLDDGIDFPDPTAVPIVVQLVNENQDVFHIPNGFINGKGRTFTWNYNVSNIVELNFEVQAKDLTDAGDTETILDGSPYFGDIKLSMLGFSNQTVAQVELNVSEPSTVVDVEVFDQTGIKYKSGATDNDINVEFTLSGDIIQPSGITVDVVDNHQNIQYKLMRGADDLGNLPVVITPTETHSSDHTLLEKLPSTQYNLVLVDPENAEAIEQTHRMTLEYTDNATGDQVVLDRSFNYEKAEPLDVSFRDPTTLAANPQGPVSKMFMADLDINFMDLEIYGTGFPENETATITSINPGAGFLSLHHTIHPDDTNAGNDNITWSGSNTYDVDDGNFSLKIRVRVATPHATNNTRGIGTFTGRLQMTVGTDTVLYDLDANQTQGNLLTKQFTAADTGWNPNLDMLLNRTDLVQLGADGLGTDANINFIITGGGGGSGGSTTDNFGSQGIRGKIAIGARSIPAARDVTIRIGTGGEAGGATNSAGGTTGSLGRTGGNSDTATVDNVVYRSGGGGGGYSQVTSDTLNFVDIIAGGGGGGTGGIDFGTAVNVYPNPKNAQAPATHDITLAEIPMEILQLAPGGNGDEPIAIFPTFLDAGLSVGETGTTHLIQQNNPVVGSIGGGGGGLRGGQPGCAGQGGTSLGQLTPRNEAGSTGAFAVTLRGYTDNVDDLVSLTAVV